MEAKSGDRLVVCLGASIVHGNVSFNFVDLLRERLGPRGFRLVNAGVNGDLAYNVLQRLDSVISLQPDFVVVLVGTNDAMATMSERAERRYTRVKGLPQRPTLDWYRENMESIVGTLQQRTGARIALSSLPVLGEDLTSESNRIIERYNDAIKGVTEKYRVPLLPVYESQAQYLRSARRTSGRPFRGFGLMWKAILRHRVLGQSLDKISEKNGFLLTIEGIHMNTKGGTIIADLVEGFLTSPMPA